jgi:hypothetical protein
MRHTSTTHLAPILVIILAGSLAGCYTLLKHPTAAEAPDETDFSRCADCHDASYYAGPYEPYYPDAWWIYYEFPWWYDQILVSGRDTLAAPDRRGIIERDPVKRPIGGGGIGVSAPPGTISPGAGVKTPIGAGGSSTQDGTVIKKETSGDPKGGKRGIEEGNVIKRDNDAHRAGDAKDAKKGQSSDAKDGSKSSDETKDSKEKKDKQ